MATAHHRPYPSSCSRLLARKQNSGSETHTETDECFQVSVNQVNTRCKEEGDEQTGTSSPAEDLTSCSPLPVPRRLLSRRSWEPAAQWGGSLHLHLAPLGPPRSQDAVTQLLAAQNPQNPERREAGCSTSWTLMFERKQSGFIPCSDNLTCAFHLRAFSRDQKDPDTCSSLVNKPGGCSTGQGSGGGSRSFFSL